MGRDAGADQIKTAYRKAARKYHPDVNKAADASERFKEATEGVRRYSNPQKRRMYDQFGHAGPQRRSTARVPAVLAAVGAGNRRARTFAWSGGQPGKSATIRNFLGGQGGAFSGMSLDEILEQLRGGGRGGRGGGRGSAARRRPGCEYRDG